MKTRNFAALTLMLVSVFSLQTVKADEQNILLGFNFSIQQYSSDNLSESYLPSAAILRLGVNMSRHYGFESRFGVGVIKDTNSEGGSAVEVANHALLGVYGKGKLNLATTASLYGLLGVSAFDMAATRTSDQNAIFSGDKTSISLGAGIESEVVSNWLINAEILLYSPAKDSRLFAVELGAGYLF